MSAFSTRVARNQISSQFAQFVGSPERAPRGNERDYWLFAVIGAVVTNGEAKTHDVLKTQEPSVGQGGILVARLDDKPGALAQVAKNLAAARINIKALGLLSNAGPKVEVALTVDNVDKAKTIVK